MSGFYDTWYDYQGGIKDAPKIFWSDMCMHGSAMQINVYAHFYIW